MLDHISSEESPANIDKLFDDANSLFQKGSYGKALSHYHRILELSPDNPRALRAAGVVLHHLSKDEEAIEFLERALAAKPDNVEAFVCLGKILKNIGCKHAAANAFREAIALESGSSEILGELGSICLELNQYDEAGKCLEKAVELDPENWSAHFYQGTLRRDLQKFGEAITSFLKVLEINPDFVYALAHLAKVYLDQGRYDDSRFLLDRVLTIKPDSYNSQSLRLFWIHYAPGTTPEAVYRESLAYEAIALLHTGIKALTSWHLPCDPEVRLKIGLVSPDFRRHPVGYFVQAFLMLHDRERYELFCYSDVVVEDELTEILKDSVNNWRRVSGVPDNQLSAMIQRDGINVLVDLAGHTDKNRLLVFMMKPAPVQVTWAGYVGTTGVSAMDYLISDRFQSPEGAERFTVERIIRMPDDYICYCPPDYAPEVSPLPALANGYVTFGCFNNLSKVSEDAIQLWCKILKNVKGSKLFMKNVSFCDQGTIRRYLELFASYGISEDRIVVEGKSPPHEMIARYAFVDIQLDTLPYSGGLTTLESIWMGVPVVTLPGELFSSRHSLTHLMNVGLESCVASTSEEYVTIACNLANNLSHLAELRGTLRHTMMESPVCNGLAFTENLQLAFRGMWLKWCEDNVLHGIEAHTSSVDLDNQFRGDHIDLNDRGNAYSDSGCFGKAIECYEKALEIKPTYMEVAYNLGLVYFKLGALNDARRFFKKATYLDPSFGDAYLNLSTVFIHLGQNNETLVACKTLLSLIPDSPEAYNNIGTAKLNLACPLEALEAFRRAVELRPDYVQAHSNVLYAMHFIPQTTARELFMESKKWDETHAIPFYGDWVRKREFGNVAPIRIGFVSPDLYRHPVGYFVQSFFMFCDREQFEIVCYSDATIEDELTEILRDSAAEWYWVHGMSDDDLARKIYDDKIDILIDLAGHSNGNRLLVFARKPAPVQATWAGYIGTTGLSAIDYLISDHYQSPDGADGYAVEKIIRLPGDYISYCPPDFAPDVSPLPALSNGYVTFCSFNKMAKISEGALGLWAEILKRVVGAHLFIKNPSLRDPVVAKNIRRYFEERGISTDRLILEGASPHLEFFKRYHLVDIQLDTLPYSGGLTTLESLWMGVPVVTMPGALFSSRHSLTHLMNVGLPEYVAATPEEYISIACSLANDYDQLAEIRGALRCKMSESPVCDGLGFAENMHDALQYMWRCYLETSDSNRFSSPKNALISDSSRGVSLNDVVISRYNDGIECMEKGKLPDAEDVFSEVIRLSPDCWPAYNNLAMTIAKMGRLTEAESILLDLIQQQPSMFEAHNNLGNVYLALGKSNAAMRCFRKTLEINPVLTSAYSNILFCMNYLPQYTQDDILKFALEWSGKLAGCTQAGPKYVVKQSLSEKRKLRIGYVSADFRFHSVSFFLRPLFTHHNRELFEIFCFSNVAHPDAVTYEFQEYADRWIDISAMTDSQAAQYIMDAGIDILVDLSGHTSGNRLSIFRARPALIQISWLGYPNTTGLSEIRYRLTDSVADPDTSDSGYVETLYRMPDAFLCYQPPDVIPDVEPLPSDKNGYVTFCSFNNVAKLNDQTVSVWSKLMHQLPDSRFLLKSSNKCTEPLLHRHVMGMFAKEGIGEDRIELLQTTDTIYAHLNKYATADIALDTFPYNGTTTTFEALMMGIPVVTLAGMRHSSRVGASILTHLGNSEWVAQSPEEYCNAALALASDKTKLRSIRFSLRSKLVASLLCNGAEFVGKLESAYLDMIKSDDEILKLLSI